MGRLQRMVWSSLLAAEGGSLALHWYTQAITYPLFSKLDGQVFAAYHRAYLDRVGRVVYPTYGALGVALLASLWRPPPGGRRRVLVLGALHAAVMAVSVARAAPLHARFGTAESLAPGGLQRLLGYNRLRVLASAVGVVVAGWPAR